MSVTADNASNNDTLTDALAEALPEFQGTYSRTRCFLHILNIVVKAILKQFDVKDVPDAEALVDDDVRQLAELVQELESEEVTTQSELRAEQGDPDIEMVLEDVDDQSWMDEVETMDDEEMAEYEQEIRPLKMVLVKVRTSRSPSPVWYVYSPCCSSARSHSRSYTRLLNSSRPGTSC